MTIIDANTQKAHYTCLRCGRIMWTDRCHRICKRCQRRNREEGTPVRPPLRVVGLSRAD